MGKKLRFLSQLVTDFGFADSCNKRGFLLSVIYTLPMAPRVRISASGAPRFNATAKGVWSRVSSLSPSRCLNQELGGTGWAFLPAQSGCIHVHMCVCRGSSS